jgi:hypothetical protein
MTGAALARWNADSDFRSIAGRGIDAEFAAVALDDMLNDRKAKAGSA